MLEKFTASKDFREKIQPFEELGREIPFLFSDTSDDRREASVEGRADLVIRDDEGILVVDYKTIKVSKSNAQTKAREFREQGGLYCRAVSEIFNREKVRFCVAFLRPAVLEMLDLDEGGAGRDGDWPLRGTASG